MGSTLSSQLIDAGLISSVEAQKLDGRAGNPSIHAIGALVASGVREDALAGFFIERGFGPLVTTDVLDNPQRRALRAIPRSLADRLLALPLEVDDRGVIVAMADPSDKEAVIELQKAMGERVRPAVALYTQMRAAIAKAYMPSETPPTPTSTSNSDVIELTTRRQPEGALPLVRPKQASSGRPLVADEHGIWSSPPQNATSEVWDAAWSAAENKAQEPMLSKPPRPTALDIAPDLAHLSTSPSRDELLKRACAIAAGEDTSAVFLAVRQGSFRGHCGAGVRVSEDAISNLLIPSGSASMLRDVFEKSVPYFGSWGTSAADRLLRSAIGAHGETISIAPVAIKKRVVGILCIDDQADPAVAPAVADAIAESLLVLLAKKKA